MLTWMLLNTAVAAALAAVVLPLCRLLRSRPACCHLLWLLVLARLVAPPLPVPGWPGVPLEAWVTRAAGGLQSLVGRAAAVVEDSAILRWRDGDDGTDGLPTDPKPQGLAGNDRAAVATVADTDRPLPGDETDSTAWLAAASLERLALTAWLLGGLLVLAVQLRRALQFHRRVAGSQQAPDELLRTVGYVSRLFAVRAPRVRVLAGLGSPVVWAAGRTPFLLWPATEGGALSSGCTQGIVAHELAHLRRRDHWVAWMELAALALCFWNPVFWLARRHLRRYAEQACDAWVLWALPGHRRAYAEALIDVAERSAQRAPTVPVLAVTDTSPQDFQRRLTMIMNTHVTRGLSPLVAGPAVLAAALLLPSVSVSGAEPGGTTPGERALPALDASLAASVERASLESEAGLRSALAVHSGEWDGVIEAYTQLLAIAPDAVKARHELVHAQLAAGQSEAALASLAPLVGDADLGAEALVDMAAAEVALGRTDAALGHLEQALARGFGKLARLSGEPLLAPLHDEPRFEALVTQFQQLHDVQEQAGQAVETKQWQTAVDGWRAALAIAPQSGLATHMTAYSLFGLGRPQEALPLCEQQLAMGFRPPVALYNMACGKALTGDVDGALQCLLDAVGKGFDMWELLANDPDLKALAAEPAMLALRDQAAREQAQWADAKEATLDGDWAAAATRWEGLLAARPDDGKLLGLLGEALFALGDDSAAQDAFLRQVRSGHAVCHGLYGIARTEARLGNEPLALAYLQAAVATGFDEPARLKQDGELAELRSDPVFAALVERSTHLAALAPKAYGGDGMKQRSPDGQPPAAPPQAGSDERKQRSH